MRWSSAGCAVLAASLSASVASCTLTDLTGFSGGARSPDASPFVAGDAGPADASPDAIVGAGVEAGTGPFCTSERAAGWTFCEDFDRAGSGLERFSFIEQAGGALGVDDMGAVSPTRALFASSKTAGVYAALVLAGAASRGRVEASIRIDEYGGASGSEILTLSFAGNYAVGVWVRGATPELGLWDFSEAKGLRLRGDLGPVVLGGWTRLALDVDLQARSATVQRDGTTLLSGAAIEPFASSAALEARVGVPYFEGGPRALRMDDVLIGQ